MGIVVFLNLNSTYMSLSNIPNNDNIVSVWEEKLEPTTIKVDDNFFQKIRESYNNWMGGHLISAGKRNAATQSIKDLFLTANS